MSGQSAIEWTDATWNPVTGCSKVSPTARTGTRRRSPSGSAALLAIPSSRGFDLRLWPNQLDLPLRWRKAKLIFVNSMSDLFHPEIPEWFTARVWDTMVRACWHTFQVLTRRPKRCTAC